MDIKVALRQPPHNVVNILHITVDQFHGGLYGLREVAKFVVCVIIQLQVQAAFLQRRGLFRNIDNRTHNMLHDIEHKAQ